MIYQQTVATGNICRCNTLRIEKVWRGWKIDKCYVLGLANSADLKTTPIYRNFLVRVFYSSDPYIKHKSATFKLYLCCVFNRSFSDTGLFIAWAHPLFLSIHKNKFQPPQVHRFYAWKHKEISTEWKYNILKIDWKYSITSHGKCPKYKEYRGINLSSAEVFSAINPFLKSGDNRSHIPENTPAAKIFRFVLCDLFTKVNKRPAPIVPN